MEWLYSQDLVGKLIGKLDPAQDSDVHANSAVALVGFISQQQQMHWSASLPSAQSRFTASLVDSESVRALLQKLLSGSPSTLEHGLTVLVELVRHSTSAARAAHGSSSAVVVEVLNRMGDLVEVLRSPPATPAIINTTGAPPLVCSIPPLHPAASLLSAPSYHRRLCLALVLARRVQGCACARWRGEAWAHTEGGGGLRVAPRARRRASCQLVWPPYMAPLILRGNWAAGQASWTRLWGRTGSRSSRCCWRSCRSRALRSRPSSSSFLSSPPCWICSSNTSGTTCCTIWSRACLRSSSRARSVAAAACDALALPCTECGACLPLLLRFAPNCQVPARACAGMRWRGRGRVQ